jgi:ankyrin repeat protein
VNAKDEDKNTPLHYAAENGHLLGVRILLDAGAKLSARNDEEDTPVHTAAENGHLQSVTNNNNLL